MKKGWRLSDLWQHRRTEFWAVIILAYEIICLIAAAAMGVAGIRIAPGIFRIALMLVALLAIIMYVDDVFIQPWQKGKDNAE